MSEANLANPAAVPPVVISASQRRQIEQEGVAAYPDECCGLIYGRDIDGRRVVEELEPVPNAFDSAERYHRFSISPKQLMLAERTAAEAGRLVLGFYHSHPDHPAKPSEYDREHAWPFYSYVIVAIHVGRPVDLTCWQLDEQTEQMRAQPIVGEG